LSAGNVQVLRQHVVPRIFVLPAMSGNCLGVYELSVGKETSACAVSSKQSYAPVWKFSLECWVSSSQK